MIKIQEPRTQNPEPRTRKQWTLALTRRPLSGRSSPPLLARALLLATAMAVLALIGAGLGPGWRRAPAVAEQAIAPTAAAQPTASATPLPAPAAMPAAHPPAAATPAPTPLPASAWPVVLRESFDQAAPGWPEVLAPSWHSSYRDGGYELALDSRPSFSTSAPLVAPNFELSADVRIARGQAGLFFLLGRPNDFYRLLIDAQGHYRLEWQQVGAARPLLDWTSSAALQTGEGATNRLAVRRTGDELALYANGQPLASYTLPPGATLESRVGLALDAPPGEQSARAWFDSIEVRAPPAP